MKIKIKDLEKKLGKTIKKNTKVVGVDTAKRCGVCFITTTNTMACFDWMFLEFNASSQKEQLIQIYNEFGKLFNNEDLAIIEEVFVGFSRKGSISLAKMGTLVIAQCLNKKIDFQTINAVSARNKFFKINYKIYKGRTKEAVANYLKNALDIWLDDYDISDAIILALCGICENINFTISKKKHRKRKK